MFPGIGSRDEVSAEIKVSTVAWILNDAKWLHYRWSPCLRLALRASERSPFSFPPTKLISNPLPSDDISHYLCASTCINMLTSRHVFSFSKNDGETNLAEIPENDLIPTRNCTIRGARAPSNRFVMKHSSRVAPCSFTDSVRKLLFLLLFSHSSIFVQLFESQSKSSVHVFTIYKPKTK